jgi:uncharacterized glyoxalase superfamily protein PhnB
MIVPILYVRDITRALVYYQRVFGFESAGAVPGLDGCPAYGEAYLHDNTIRFARLGDQTVAAVPPAPVTLVVHLPPQPAITTLFARIVAQRAAIIAPLQRQLWGDLTFTVADLDGYHLMFSQAVPFPTRAGRQRPQPRPAAAARTRTA